MSQFVEVRGEGGRGGQDKSRKVRRGWGGCFERDINGLLQGVPEICTFRTIASDGNRRVIFALWGVS